MPKTALQRAIDKAAPAQPRATADACVVLFETLPPSANKLYVEYRVWEPRKNGYQTRRSMTAPYETWRKAAVDHIMKVQRVPMVLGDVAVEIEMGPRHPLADIDNKIKPVMDALVQARVIDDDRYCVDIRARWAEITGARATVRKV